MAPLPTAGTYLARAGTDLSLITRTLSCELYPISPAFSTEISGERTRKAKLQLTGGCHIDLSG